MYDMGLEDTDADVYEIFTSVNSQIMSIVDYEPHFNRFIVNGTHTDAQDVGVWTIRVRIDYYEEVDDAANASAAVALPEESADPTEASESANASAFTVKARV